MRDDAAGRLFQLRADLGLTRAEMAERIGARSGSLIGDYERRARAVPKRLLPEIERGEKQVEGDDSRSTWALARVNQIERGDRIQNPHTRKAETVLRLDYVRVFDRIAVGIHTLTHSRFYDRADFVYKKMKRKDE